MTRRYIPVITESDKELPYYLVDVGQHWNQEHISRPNGYLYQWMQCVEGEGQLLLNGKSVRVKEGMGILLFKGEAHEYYAVSPSWIVNWIVFDGEQVERFLKQTAGFSESSALFISRPEIFAAKVQTLLDIGHSDITLKSIQFSSIVYTLLTDILLFTSIQPNGSATNLNIRLQPVFQYIEQNFSKSLVLDDMAEMAGYTPQYLCTVFKRTTGIRIFQYINSVRIKKSKELLLQNPHMQVKEVAALAGFEDVNYFCTVFRKHEQLSPSQFRRIHLNQS